MTKEEKQLMKQDKKELEKKEEQTYSGRWYVPETDIFETDRELYLRVDMPGVDKENIKINLEKGVLQIEGSIHTEEYSDLEPVYTEYNVGHFNRRFQLSEQVDQEKISAEMHDGVLNLTLPKREEAQPRKIVVK